ncbi:terpene synthase family protein [Chitinophaga nivalis]|uniref:Terpene synthase n=1 Tax=Chitinophaga nivalis TaxID=2991709 RepID=A0ABT3IM55_9BACT|nr:hypothetical protein [Chitinophaga nivalis]MCW3465275.1 hypothetical protein [Chitinophaga nivalis]MCW3485033.1 hypothetical protein [Chitinophaga nivalis]
MKKQIIPGLTYPFHDLRNSKAEAIEQESQKWLSKDYVVMPDEFNRKTQNYKYHHTHVGYMAARMYPFASFEKLKPITRFLLWGLINDDLYENSPVNEIQNVRDRSIATLRGFSLQPRDNSLLMQLKVQREEMLNHMPMYWMNRYINSIDKGFEGMQLEAYYKSNMIFPTIEDYVTIREKAVLVYPLIDLCELQAGHALPDRIFYHPVIQHLASLVCKIIAFANDYFSVEKEREKDVMNIVLILEHQFGLSTTDAYLKAISMHDDNVSAFCKTANELPDFGTCSHLVKRLIDNIGILITGHRSWYEKDTHRYVDQRASGNK